MKSAAGVPVCGSTGSLIGRSVAFVLLSAVDADDAESVPAGIHCGRCALFCDPLASKKHSSQAVDGRSCPHLAWAAF